MKEKYILSSSEGKTHYADKNSHKKRSEFHRQLRRSIQRGELPVNQKYLPVDFEELYHEDQDTKR